jgi:hypothetical protein
LFKFLVYSYLIFFKTIGLISTIAGTIGTRGYSGVGGKPLNAKLSLPYGIVFDYSTNKIFFSDSGNFRIRVLSTFINSPTTLPAINIDYNSISTYAGNGGRRYSGDNGYAINAQFGDLVGLTTDTNGDLYVVDTSYCVIRKIDKITNIIKTIAGTGSRGYNDDNIQAAKLSFRC